MNIFTSGMPELCEDLKNNLLPNEAIFERNFEQILGYVRENNVEKICIFIDVWNVYGQSFNGMRGQGAAEKIHQIDPNVQVLIWDGREYDANDPNIVIPPAFQLSGEPKEIKNKNELYLEFADYKENLIDSITKKFFNGELSFNDIPKRDCIEITL